MKKSDIERQLKNQLSESANSDFDAVWNKCVTCEADGKELIAEPVPVTATSGNTSVKNRRRIVGVSVALLAVLLCLAVVFGITFSVNTGGNFVVPSSSGYFVIDVNPSVRVNYDNGGVVSSAEGLNADGQNLLDGIELVGLTYDKASDALFDACETRGYFSAERGDNAILITASKDNGEKDEKITAEINKRFAQKFEDKKMKGAVISDVDNSKWQKEADKYGINGQKYEFIMRYLELGGELDESEYSTVTISELYSRISELGKNSKDK